MIGYKLSPPGSPFVRQIQKLIMTPRVRREVDERAFADQTVLPKDYDGADKNEK